MHIEFLTADCWIQGLLDSKRHLLGKLRASLSIELQMVETTEQRVAVGVSKDVVEAFPLPASATVDSRRDDVREFEPLRSMTTPVLALVAERLPKLGKPSPVVAVPTHRLACTVRTAVL